MTDKAIQLLGNAIEKNTQIKTLELLLSSIKSY